MAVARDIPEWLSIARHRPPRPPRTAVARERLFRSIEQSVAGALTLIVGPPGSGKTVLASTWAAQTTRPVVWLGLDPADVSPQGFWQALTQALDEWRAAIGADGARPLVVVLDDAQDLAGVLAGELDLLLERPPDDLRLVLLSRRDPPLRLGRLRVAGQLAEIRAADLACTPDETQAVLRGLGVAPDPHTSARLQERSEGWMAAIVLAALSLRTSPDGSLAALDVSAGHDAALSEYLMAELLSAQPADVRTFLLRTSIVETIDGALAEQLSGQDHGHARLEQLAADGLLLTPVARPPGSFRYHGLFAELLRAELHWSRADEVPGLHAAAARWFAERRDVPRAVQHAVQAHDWAFAARLAAERWTELLVCGTLATLEPLLDALPAGEDREDPELALALAAIALEVQDPMRAAPRVQQARAAALSTAEGAPGVLHGLALVELVDAHGRGDVHRARAAGATVLEGEPAARGGPALTSFALAVLGATETWTGSPLAGRRHARRALLAAGEARSEWLRFVALCHLSGAESSCGDLAAAQRRSAEALALAHQHDWARTSHAVAAAIVAGLVAVAQCRFDDAAALLDAAELAAARTPHRVLRVGVALPQAMLLNAQGRDGEALDLVRMALAELGDWPADSALTSALRGWEGRMLSATGDRPQAAAALAELPAPEGLPVAVTRARLRVAEGAFAEAHAVLRVALERAAPVFAAVPVEALLVDALALDGMLEHDRAAAQLERALDRAERGGILRPIVSLGPAVVPLLHRQVRRGTAHRGLIERALGLIEARTPMADTASDLREPLTLREEQVLRYLPTRLNNAEIAAELFVSINTVKTHLRAIYRKLDAENRRDAVARAQRLKLVSPR